jgi:Flp pilus assembly protein TadD
MRKSLFVMAIAAACLLGGCASSKTPTQKQIVVKQWNDARSSVLIGLAKDEYSNANFDKARQSIDEAMKLSPDSGAARILSAKLYIETGQLEAAERELASARQLDPANAEADYLSGVVYQRWDQPERALEFYQHACDKAPAELAYVLAKSEMLVAMNRQGEALASLQQRVTYFEHSGAIRDEVGLLLVQAQRYDEAVEMLRRASILAPDDLTIREHLATACYYDKKYSDSCDVLKELTQKSPYDRRSDLWQMMGECQMQVGLAGDAVASFQQATELLDSSPDIWLSLAKAELQLSELRRCDIAIQKSLSLNSNNSQAYLLQGYLRLRQTRTGDALEAFLHATQLDPSDTVSLCMVGYTLQKLGRSAEARACYEQALKITPRDEMATQLMAGLDLHE